MSSTEKKLNYENGIKSVCQACLGEVFKVAFIHKGLVFKCAVCGHETYVPV